MKSIFEEDSKLQKFLDVEAALARAHANVGNIPKSAANAITKKANTKFVKVSRVKTIEKRTKHDLMAVVKALGEASGPAGKHVHLGATSYDIVDTANALQFKEALGIVERDLKALEKTLKKLAKKHINTVAVGRTHGQHAIPITYGLKFSIWATEIKRHIERINESKKRVLVGKMSGAVGTQASFGKKGIRIQKLVMNDLGLASTEVSNQIVQRDRYAELISLLALIAATLDKIAREIRNLSRTEILELSEKFEEKGQVGSSTMPHKRNPINAENICGLSRVIKSNVFVALENVSLEHERDLTNSSSERIIIPESFILLDEILKRTNKVMENIVLYPENIKRNLNITGGMEMAEAIMMGLTKKGMGRQEAHELLRKLSIKVVKEKKSLKEVLAENATIKKHLNESEIDWLLDPQNYTGTAVEQVKNVTGRK
jgi:adenylosuccinate lyase